MVLKVPDAGLALESSSKSAASLPAQAFAITLSDKAIEDMIECVQNGQGIQLSMGDAPSFLLGDQEYRIPNPPTDPTYDVYYSNSTSPKTAGRLPNPTMSIFHQPRYQALVTKAVRGEKSATKPKQAKSRAPASKPASSKKDPDDADADIEALQLRVAQVEAEKQENSTRVLDRPLAIKNGKVKAGKSKLLSAQGNAPTRSLPTSPALSGIGSPSLGPVGAPGQQAQERAKRQRFPIIHELAVGERTYGELFSEWGEGTEQEFKTALEKVASFDNELQKWILRTLYWKELDVFEYEYKSEEDRQAAIDNAIKRYDRQRLPVTDPLWQKLLPKASRGRGICPSKVQAAIVNRPQAPTPKINVHKTDGSSANGSGDSGKDESSQTKKVAKGGESMARSNSQPLPAKTKKSDGQSQAKRILSTKKTASAKPSPKASPTKQAAAKTATSSKNPRIKSKEFVSDSDSESDEAPLSISVPKSKPKPAAKPTVERPAAKAPASERSVSRQAEAKAKPAPKPAPKTKESIKAQTSSVKVSSARPQKRPREDEDDSSSSATPLSKRLKPKELPARMSENTMKHLASDASQNSRGTSSGMSLNNKSKNTSPMKSSPLASSPPTNASDLDSTDDSRASMSKKRKATDLAQGDESFDDKAKRQRLSPKVLQKAHRFRKFYASYEALHKEVVALEHPPDDKMTDLLDMRERLRVMKNEIYKEVSPEA